MPKCNVSLSGPAESIGASGGAGTVAVSTQPECAWTATAEASWITGLAPLQGQGDGQVQFQVQPNPNATTRNGAIDINGQRAVIQQSASACEIDLRISVSQFPASGGAGVVTVAAPGGCAWTASSTVSWIVVSPTAGSGSGDVNFTVAGNSGAARTGTMTIGEHPVTIQQGGSGTQTCSVTLNPTSQSVPAAGATGISVTVTAPSGCPRPAISNAAWITIASGATGSGNGTVTLNVAANTGSARTSAVTIGGQTFTVNQAAAAAQCSYSLNPTAQTVGSDSGTALPVAVTAGAGCAWTGTSNVSWLQITSGSSGTGNGTVNFTFSSFSGSNRTGTLTIAGQTLTVTQVRCTITVTPSTQSVSSLGGTFSGSVATQTGCRWTAESNRSWITVTNGANRVGSGTFSYSVGVNLGGARSGEIDVEDERLNVNQAAVIK